jgi:hypothetical protein
MPTMGSIDFSDAPSAWPVTGMILIAPGDTWHQVACVGSSRGQAYARISGFRLAAEVLAQHSSRSTADLDVLVFPYLYCWRQHIELALKKATMDLDRLAGEVGAWPKGHRLLPLWERFVRAQASAGLNRDDGIEQIAPVIRELHSLDPSGDAFRYHIHTDLSPTLPQLGNVSINTIADVMARVSNYLEAAIDEISILLEHKADMDAELANAVGYRSE